MFVKCYTGYIMDMHLRVTLLRKIARLEDGVKSTFAFNFKLNFLNVPDQKYFNFKNIFLMHKSFGGVLTKSTEQLNIENHKYEVSFIS